MGSLLASALIQAYWIIPYTPLYPKQVQRSSGRGSDSEIAILFANVLMSNRSSDGLKDLIREADPDVILLVETDDWWAEQFSGFDADHPFTIKQPQDNTYGMLLFSRLKLIGTEIKFLVQDDVPSFHGKVELRSGEQLKFRCLHPRPPVPTEEERAEPRDAELLIVGKENKSDRTPFIVFGDLNDVAWSRTNDLFQKVSGLLDPRVGRGFFPTFHAGFPLFRFPLDHLFHSNHFRLVEFRRLARFGSDHFPIFSKLFLETEAVFAQPELAADDDEISEANETIAMATVNGLADSAAVAKDLASREFSPDVQAQQFNKILSEGWSR